MGFTLFATLDEFGDFLSTFVLPVALTEAQQVEVRHGSDMTDLETYFYVSEDGDLTDEHDLDMAMEFIAEAHVVDVKAGLFSS